MNESSSIIFDLVQQFRKLSGIGAKSAHRLSFQVLSWNKSDILKFAEVLKRTAEAVSFCPDCFNFSSNDSLCEICSDLKRDKKTICIVASVRELHAIERTGEYKGLYHVLHGLISPLDGISPDDLRIKELLGRLKRSETSETSEKNEGIEELIMALSPSTEGEATTLYLTRLLKPFVSRISRLAFGLSVGSDIDQTDELTLARALEGRRIL